MNQPKGVQAKEGQNCDRILHLYKTTTCGQLFSVTLQIRGQRSKLEFIYPLPIKVISGQSLDESICYHELDSNPWEKS